MSPISLSALLHEGELLVEVHSRDSSPGRDRPEGKLRKINWHPELYFPYFFHSSIKLQSQLLLVCILLWWLKNTVQLPNKFILQFSSGGMRIGLEVREEVDF